LVTRPRGRWTHALARLGYGKPYRLGGGLIACELTAPPSGETLARLGTPIAGHLHDEPITAAKRLTHVRAPLARTTPPGRRQEEFLAMRTEWIVAAVVAALALYLIAVFNRLIRQRNMVREGWSGIDVQLRRRSDLVPNLVETVKGYAAHERGLFEDVTQQRARSMATEDVRGRAAAEQGLQSALGRLLAVAEAYPDLKANQNFLALQQDLVKIEDELQMARRYYNGTVRDLNILIQSFPNNIFAGMLGFREEPFFELEDRSQAQAPSIAFAERKA
jgi:LemA protein